MALSFLRVFKCKFCQGNFIWQNIWFEEIIWTRYPNKFGLLFRIVHTLQAYFLNIHVSNSSIPDPFSYSDDETIPL